MTVPSTPSFLLGGGERRDYTPLQAADWFAQQYLPPDLSTNSVRFPEEKVDFGLDIQTPLFTTDKEWNEVSKGMFQDEKNHFNTHKTHFKGGKGELDVWKYLTRIPQSHTTALLHNYNLKMFKRFTGQPEMNKEFDFILIFPDYRKFVVIEVKAGAKGSKDWVEQLRKGEAFYNEVLAYIGVKESDWEYIPVAAFPNAANKSKVKTLHLYSQVVNL